MHPLYRDNFKAFINTCNRFAFPSLSLQNTRDFLNGGNDPNLIQTNQSSEKD